MVKIKPIQKKNILNRDEQRYADELSAQKTLGKIQEWYFGALKFVLAPKTTYTPDFLVIGQDNIEIIEIKGFLRDDAAVKFKTAARVHSWARWRMLRWRRGEWETIYDL